MLNRNTFFPLNPSYDLAPFWVLEHSSSQMKNIGGGSYLINQILDEFGVTSTRLEESRQKIEDIVLKHGDVISSVEDIANLDKDEDLKQFLSSNVIKGLVE